MTGQPLHAGAPPERLAAVRILTGSYALAYLVVRSPQFLALRDREGDGFAGVGPLAWLDRPVTDEILTAVFALALVGGIAFVAGVWFRVSGPTFALAVLALSSYRASWGQVLWFDNLVTLHLLILGVAASADAWSLDARRRARPRRSTIRCPRRLLCVVVAVTTDRRRLLRYGVRYRRRHPAQPSPIRRPASSSRRHTVATAGLRCALSWPCRRWRRPPC